MVDWSAQMARQSVRGQDRYGSEAGNTDRGGDFGGDHGFDPAFWQGVDGDLYQDAGTGGFKPGHDGDPCGGLCGHGSDPESFRRYAGRGRYDDAHVDFHCDDDPDPRAHCLRHFFLYKNGAAAERKAGMHLYLAAGFLADRSADHVCLLPERKVEGEGDLRTKRVRTVNLQAEDGAAAWNTTTV